MSLQWTGNLSMVYPQRIDGLYNKCFCFFLRIANRNTYYNYTQLLLHSYSCIAFLPPHATYLKLVVVTLQKVEILLQRTASKWIPKHIKITSEKFIYQHVGSLRNHYQLLELIAKVNNVFLNVWHQFPVHFSKF